MLRKAWYAVSNSDSVHETPHKVFIHDTCVVLYRNSQGDVCAMDSFCPHRGCDLSLGEVEDYHMTCPYHGWQFDNHGHCIHIPANRSGAPIPHSYRIRTYPACEKLGLIWIYSDSVSDVALVPPLPVFPELMDGERFRFISFSVQWNAHFTRVVESVLDVSHLPFVHPETSGGDISPVVVGPEFHVTDDRLVIYPTPFAPAHPMDPVPDEWAGAQEGRRTEVELRFPNHWMIRTPVGDDEWMCTYLTFTPVGAGVTDIYGMALRDFEHDNEFLDEFHIAHTQFVMGQDQRIVESQRPRYTPFDLHRELHVASDAPVLRYRMLLKKAWEEENGVQ